MAASRSGRGAAVYGPFRHNNKRVRDYAFGRGPRARVADTSFSIR
jgi:hypothetical protein